MVARAIDAQRERRPLVAGREDRFPVRADGRPRTRSIHQRGYDQRATGLARARPRVQRLALAQVAPQHRVDERLRLRARATEAAAFDRAVDDGERRARACGRADRARPRPAPRAPDRRAACVASARVSASSRAPVAQRAVGELLHERAARPAAPGAPSAGATAASAAGSVAPSSTRRTASAACRCASCIAWRRGCASPRDVEARAGRDAAAPRRTPRRSSACPPAGCTSRQAQRALAAGDVDAVGVDREHRARRRPARATHCGLGAPRPSRARRRATCRRPGTGSKARTWRSIAGGVCAPVDRRVGARRSSPRRSTPVAGCGVAVERAVAREALAARRRWRRAPAAASLSCSVPAVSRGAIGTADACRASGRCRARRPSA